MCFYRDQPRDPLSMADVGQALGGLGIIAGIVLEGLILALLDFSGEMYDRLPGDHDPLWDHLAKVGRPL